MDIAHELNRLNPQQREAVLHTEGPLLILAGAGSGKTRVLTVRTAYLISRGTPPGRILAVTFTNKAAREMKGRVASIIRQERGGGPLISTFHSLCLIILRREIERLGYRRDFTIYDTSDQVSLLRGMLGDIRTGDKAFRPEAVLERISRAKNRMQTEAVRSDAEDDIESISERLYPQYRELLKSLNALDFDDLLLLTLDLFRDHPEVLEYYRDRYQYLMVDEYQDTNRVQYELVRLLAGERRNLCVVGDDDQSIYAWRGANLGNILDFEHDFPATKIVRLEQNYRSFGNILTAANAVIRKNRRRMEKALWTDRGSGPEVRLFRAADGDAEAAWVADRIMQLKYEKKLAFEDCAVIYRANIFSRQFEEALRKLRIPYRVVGGMSYFEHREVKDIAAYLKVIANPRDDVSLLRIANTPRRGLGPTALAALSDFSRQQAIPLLSAFEQASEIGDLAAKNAASASALARLITTCRERFAVSGSMGATLKDLLEQIGYRDYVYGLFKSAETALSRIENVEGFVESLAHYDKDEPAPSLHGFLETLALDNLPNGKEERRESGVTLISFHSAKGLEFPVVFIVGLEEDILPHRKSLLDTDGLEEERRLFYVGMTRAMEELYLCRAAYRVRYGKRTACSPSRFLDELPSEGVSAISEGSGIDEGDEETAAKTFFANIKEMLGG